MEITPESTRMTANVPNENTVFFLMEGFFFSLRLNSLNLINYKFIFCKLTQNLSYKHYFCYFCKNHTDMKRIIIITAMFLTLGTIAACGNDDKKGTVIELTSEDFNNKVFDLESEEMTYLGKLPAIVDFNASWCGPCRQIAPILEELAAEYEGQIVIYKVDVDKCGDIAAAFGIQSIPAVLYIPVDGEPQMTVGSRGKNQFKTEIQNILLKK